jgi:uncharacterized coiled-coil protein SlyX
VIRFLLGIVVGIIVTIYFFHTESGEYLLSSSTKVRHLEEKLQHADEQQNNLAKKLEEATAVIEKMATQFTALEQRFQALIPPEGPKTNTPPVVEAPTPPAPEPGAPVPDSGTILEPPAAPPTPEESGASNPNDPPSPL